ncbi:hypothetical protein OLZ33_12680 [Pantoea ananatis]|uniref:transcriptional antitermination N peptide n=1 Tax=Pantoea ananas TaxID=553 RepID=UPI00158A1D6A|nr:hypothetical protein [Pantoea ananatis]MBA4822568.1 hypothetical protein [Pantoea ananatis]MCW1832837.1 hypothetical protein [Pantoea ananatis]QKV87746.1 hypothetical protein FOB88_11680 [Pantoea ananatis]
MAIIHYGKSVFSGNARTRRHQRRQPLNRLKQSIDDALNYPPEPRPLRRAEQICQRQVTSVVDRAVSAPQRRSKEISGFDNCCLPHVHLYAVR